MARTGRPRKPTALKKLQGTLRKHRMIDSEWMPPAGSPSMPVHFGSDAKREWQRVVPMLLDAGLLTLADGAALEAYCEAYQDWKAAARLIAKDGMMDGSKAHAAVKIQNEARNQCMTFAQRFGLDPASRSKLSAPKKPPIDKDEGFLFGKLKVVDGGK